MRLLNRKDTTKKAAPKKAGAGRGKTARRRPTPRWVRQSARAAGIVAIFGVAFGGPAWLWQSGWVARAAGNLFDGVAVELGHAGLRVDQIYLTGRDHASAKAIMASLGIRRGEPLLAVDLSAAQHRLEKLNWIRAASVEREYPNAIRVRIDERKPLALWQRDDKLYLVDNDGVIITDRDLQRFANLLVIVGKDAPEHAQDLLSILGHEPGLRRRVNAAVRVGDRRWNVRMDNGVYVRLPATGALVAWQRFARLERQHDLLNDDLISIDLRIPDQLIVRTRDGSPNLQRRISARKGKET